MPTQRELLINALKLRPQEVAALTPSIERRYVAAYVDTIGGLIIEYGCTASAKEPTGRALRGLRELVERDIESIVGTLNSDIERKVDQVLKAHPDWSKQQYTAELQIWLSGRNRQKDQQIARASQTNGAEYARTLFIENNRQVDGLYTWDANPPIVENSHKECIQRVKEGAVVWEVAKSWRKTHPNCRHKVQQTTAKAVNCQAIWRG